MTGGAASDHSTGKPRRTGNVGPRPRHVPVRTCVGCRESDAKRSYVRIVRTSEGTVEVDPTGKKNGRGAYLCRRRACWRKALDTKAIDRALKVEVGADTQAILWEYARSYFPPDDDSAPARA